MQNKMHKMTQGLLIAAFLVTGWMATSAQNSQDPVVMILGKDSVTLSEFKNNFLKNNNLNKTSEKELREYIDLFVNFRLKCAEAKELRLDTLPSLQRELRGYRSQAAAPYLTEKSVNEQLVNEALEHLHWDIRASHIMRRISSDASPKDTLAAYTEMMNIRKRILKGENFNDVAFAESDDPSARPRYDKEVMVYSGNKGDLGYFTAFNMIYPFEKAAFNTPVGTVSLPVRSPYGYHLIMVQDRQPAISTWTVSHILITYPENATAKDSAGTKAAAQEAYRAIRNGMDFEAAVKKYCTDEGLTLNGGKMDPFPSGRFEGDFMAPLYKTEENEITPPFETRYGWHIVKVIKKEPFVETPGIRGEIRQRINRDTRSDLGPEKLVERLKKEYKFVQAPMPKDKKAVSPVEDFYTIDSVLLFKGRWKKDSFHGNREMFRFAYQVVRQSDFAAYIEKNQFPEMRRISVHELINHVYPLFVRRCILDYEEEHLEEKYPEFATLMNEYKDGILLYELSERKVWGRSETDSAGLAQFYETVKDQYMYPVRAEVVSYTMGNEKAYRTFCKLMEKGTELETINKKFAKKGQIITARKQVLQKGEDKNFDRDCPWEILMQEGNAVITKADEFRYTTVTKLLPSPKPLDEVRGTIITQYQNLLEKEWVEQLHKDNDIFIDYDTILGLIR